MQTKRTMYHTVITALTLSNLVPQISHAQEPQRLTVCKIVVNEPNNTGTFYVTEPLPWTAEIENAFKETFKKYLERQDISTYPRCEYPPTRPYVIGQTYTAPGNRLMTTKAAEQLEPNWKRTTGSPTTKGAPSNESLIVRSLDQTPTKAVAKPAPKPAATAKPAAKPTPPAKKKWTGCGRKGQPNCRAKPM